MLRQRSARFSDAVALAPRLRFADAREIATMWGLGAKAGLMACLLHSDRAFAVVDGHDELVALWGVTDADIQALRAGVPWLLGCDRVFAERRALVSLSRHWLELLLVEYDVLTNVTDEANTAHRRWLAWCGFQELRRHDRHGAGARPCVEFFRVNPARQRDAATVADALCRRPPPAVLAPLDNAAAALTAVAIEVMSTGPRQVHVPPLLEAVHTLDRAMRDGAVGPRLARRSTALAEEVAEAFAYRPPPSTRKRGDAPWQELCAALADTAETGLLAFGPSADPVAAAAPPEHPLDALLRRHGTMLTDGGRLTPVQGWRSRRIAAAGRSAGSFVDPSRRREVEDVFRQFAVQQALAAGGRLRSASLADRWRVLLAQPLKHGAAVSALRAVAAGSGALGEELERCLDAWAVCSGGAAPSVELASVGAAVTCAGALADAVSRAVLPEVRLGRVAAGLGDRLWLRRLLRARLIDVMCAAHSGAAAAVLRCDVVALLMAAALEEIWLEEPAVAPWSERLQRLVDAVLRPLGPALEIDDDARVLVLWLLPVLNTPVVHGLELQPAMTAWHLAATGVLPDALGELADLLGTDPMESRRSLRERLRRWAARPDKVELRCLLGLESGHGRSGARPADSLAADRPA
jgi:hypothetical protein